MFLELQQESVLIGRQPIGFTQHYYTEWDDGLGSDRVVLFLLISIASSQVPGEEVGKEAFQLLQDHFLHDLEAAPYDRFEGALREINHMISEKEKELDLRFIPNVHVVAGAIEGDNLYLSQRGDAAGYLVRKRHASAITDDLYDAKNKEDLFQNIASGQLEVDDSLVMVTGNLIQHLTPTEFSKIFSEQSIKTAVKDIKAMLHGELPEQMAMLSFEVLEKSQQEVSKPVIERVGSLEEEPKAPKRDRKEEALNVLRSWVEYKERFRFWEKFKHLDMRKQAIAISALSVFTVVTIGGFILVKDRQGKIDDINAKLSVAEENIAQATTQGTFDKETARNLLDNAEQLAVEVLETGYMGSKASQLVQSVEEQRDYLDNVIRVDALDKVEDFSTLTGGEALVGVDAMGEYLVVYTGTQAFQVLAGEAGSSNALDDIDKVKKSVFFDDRDVIVFLTESGKLMEYEGGNAQFADTSDGEWVQSIALADYSTRIYVLDAENNQVWKYSRGNSAYGAARTSFTEEVTFTDPVDLAIDGNIWVLEENGALRKFFAGEEVSYFVNKAPLSGAEKATAFYTDLETSQIYVLDSATNRILIYDKHTLNDNITYSSQFVFEDLNETVVDFYLNKDAGNGAGSLMLVTESALYEWAL